jgi:hypothetical protein
LQEAVKQPSFASTAAKSDVLVNIILTILHQLAPSTLQDRRPSKLNLESQTETEGRSADYKTFTPGEDIIQYARNFYGIQPGKADACASSLFTNGDGDSSKEDSGDMSMAALPKSVSDLSMAIYNTPQPKYDPVRGSVLINELLNAMASFLTTFIQSYVLQQAISLEQQHWKGDSELQSLYHNVFRNACEVLSHVASRANISSSDLKDCTDSLMKCSSNGPDFTYVSSSLETLLEIADSPSHLKSSLWGANAVKAIVNQVRKDKRCGSSK